MKLQQSFDCEFTTQDRFGILGEVHFNKAGYGDGTLQFSHKRAISKSVQLEVNNYVYFYLIKIVFRIISMLEVRLFLICRGYQ